VGYFQENSKNNVFKTIWVFAQACFSLKLRITVMFFNEGHRGIHIHRFHQTGPNFPPALHQAASFQ